MYPAKFTKKSGRIFVRNLDTGLTLYRKTQGVGTGTKISNCYRHYIMKLPLTLNFYTKKITKSLYAATRLPLMWGSSFRYWSLHFYLFLYQWSTHRDNKQLVTQKHRITQKFGNLWHHVEVSQFYSKNLFYCITYQNFISPRKSWITYICVNWKLTLQRPVLFLCMRCIF